MFIYKLKTMVRIKIRKSTTERIVKLYTQPLHQLIDVLMAILLIVCAGKIMSNCQ